MASDKTLSVPEVLEQLKQAGITDSEQMVRRWLREGKFPGAVRSEFRKEGWKIPAAEVKQFIQERNPLFIEVRKLREENERLKQEISAQTVSSSEILPSIVRSCLYSGISNKISFLNEQIKHGDYDKERVKKEYQDLKEVVDFYKSRCGVSSSPLEQQLQTLETAVNRGKEVTKTEKDESDSRMSNGEGPRELTRDEVGKMFRDATKKIKDADRWEEMSKEFLELLFPMSILDYASFSSDQKTMLYDMYKEKYVCPMSLKEFETPEEAVQYLIDRIIKKYQPKITRIPWK